MKRVEYLLLLLILIGAFTVRLYKFNNPVADWHSWRQADTSSVSRNFIKYGFDVLHPQFDDLSNVASGLDNPQGFRFVEFPIYNLYQAGMFRLIGIFNIEEWGRLVTIISSVFSTLFLYLIVKKYKGDLAGFLTAFLPFNIYFGRTILPDPSMAMTILGGIYFFDKWIENSKLKTQNSKLQLKAQIFLILSILFTASSLLLKPYALFFTLPMIYLAWKNFGFKLVLKWQLWIFVIIVIAPFVFWRLWMQQYPEGIPQSGWLFNGGNIRFKGAFFQWIFGDRIARLILGYWGMPLLILGLITKAKKEFLKSEYGFFLSFLISSLAYIFVIAKGNVQHDYYQILIIPSIAIFLALGSELLLRSKDYFNRTINYILFVICILFMFVFSWYYVRDFFNINNRSIVTAGEAVDKLTPKDAKIIAIYDGDTSFLYQTKRQGWASFEKSLPEMIKMGATHLVFVNTKESDYNLGKEYKIISATPDFILFDLHQKP